MSRIDILFEAPIEPEPYRKSAVGIMMRGRPSARLFTSAETERFERAFAAWSEYHRPRDLVLDEPVRVDVLLVMPRPKRLQRRRDPINVMFAPGRPDRDNCYKAVLDAMRAWWRDDSLVVAGHAVRVYAERWDQSRIVVRVRTLEDTDPRTIIEPIFGWSEAPEGWK